VDVITHDAIMEAIAELAAGIARKEAELKIPDRPADVVGGAPRGPTGLDVLE
jgi:hypothetical protein